MHTNQSTEVKYMTYLTWVVYAAFLLDSIISVLSVATQHTQHHLCRLALVFSYYPDILLWLFSLQFKAEIEMILVFTHYTVCLQ